MFLSLVFPAWNEEENIPLVLEEALSFLQTQEGEIILVDDGSTDSTFSIAQTYHQKFPEKIRILQHPHNLGYGCALKNGFLSAKGEWIFYTDSDLQFHLPEISRLLELSSQADIVVGFRNPRKDPGFRIFAARIYNQIARWIFHIPVRDIDCAFKIFRKDLFSQINIESTDFLVDLEVLAKAQKIGFRIAEVGVTHFPRRFGTSTVRWMHILKTLRGIFWLYRRLKILPK